MLLLVFILYSRQIKYTYYLDKWGRNGWKRPDLSQAIIEGSSRKIIIVGDLNERTRKMKNNKIIIGSFGENITKVNGDSYKNRNNINSV